MRLPALEFGRGLYVNVSAVPSRRPRNCSGVRLCIHCQQEKDSQPYGNIIAEFERQLVLQLTECLLV